MPTGPTLLKCTKICLKFSAIWTEAATQLLLAIYMEVSESRSIKFKTKRKMWESITVQINSHSYSFKREQVENRYKTLVRGYKRFIDNKKKNKTGRGRKKLDVSAKIFR